MLNLLDTAGFVPRKACGQWSRELVYLYATADVMIWLAYTAIPLTLAFFLRRRAMPFPGVLWLFTAFILCCGATHLVDAVIFEVPVYRLSAAVKAVTAVVSWATVVALIPLVPRVLEWAAGRDGPDLPAQPARDGVGGRYAGAVGAAGLAVVARWVLDPVFGDRHPFILPLLAVMFVGWQFGLRPALVCLVVGMGATLFLFVEPRGEFDGQKLGDVFGLGLSVFGGVGAAVLGEAQRAAWDRTHNTLADLRAANADLDAARRQSADALAQLDAFVAGVPVGIAFFDPDLRYVRVNDYLARANGVAAAGHVGRPLRDVLPDFSPDLEAEFRAAVAGDRPMPARAVEADPGRSGAREVWQVGAHPVRRPDGTVVGLAVTAEDVTDRVRAVEQLKAGEQRLRDSEDRFRTLAEAVPQIVWVARPDGYHEYFNRRWYEFTGLTQGQSIGWGWATPLHPDDKARAEARWKQSTDTGDSYEIEYRFRGADGAYRWFLGRAVPVRDAAGGVVRWFGTCTDIDDAKRDVDALADANARLRQEMADRRQAEADARAAGDQFQTLADHIPQLAWMAHPDGHLFWYNRRWYEFTGTPLADMAGWGWKAVHHPGHVDRVVATWSAALAAGAPWEDTFPLRRHDGRYRWFLTRAVPVRGDGGAIVRWFGTNTDVTDQRELEAALRDSESRFRAVVETIPQLVWACNPAGECEYLSRQWVDYTGVPEDRQLPFGWLDVLHPDDKPATADLWAEAVAGRAAYDLNYRIRRHDGAYRWFRARGVPVHGPDGAVARWFGTCTDIDDAVRQAERLEDLVAERTAALRRQQAFVDAILENVADGIVACDADGTLRLFNAATRQMHGLPAEPLPPDAWADRYGIYRADGVTPCRPDEVPLARALSGERVRDAEMVIRPAAGPDRFVLASGQPLVDADGNRLGAVVSMRDVTDQRAAEQKLRAFAKELQRSNEELEKFAYVASHDLQEPLRKIQAFGDRLAKKYRDALGDQGKEYVDRMLASAARMRTLIDDLLTFSRVTTKAQPFAPVDLNAVVRDVLADLEVRAAQTDGRVDVGGRLPVVAADPSQMRQVFQNLIGNAFKFHAPGRPPVVTITADRLGDGPPPTDPPPGVPDGWRITVADNGIGFEQEYAARIFEVFQRLHGRDEYDGTGIGLAICKKVVERHGGSIAARGAPGIGARFVIDLPVSAGPTADGPRGNRHVAARHGTEREAHRHPDG